jgi:hypothetical protein
VAEVLFLRKQLAFYQEHQVPPRKLTDATRFSLALRSQLFHWRAALMIVKPETLISWHRQGFKLFWRRKSRLGRPRIPETLRRLMVRMVRENPTWGEERIAAELSVKLGILVLPRTVRAYWPQDRDPRDGRRTSSQQWRTFVRNHAKAIVAADFLVAITAGPQARDGNQAISRSLPARQAWPRPDDHADEQFSVGDLVNFLREPDARNAPVRFDEREQETEPCQTGLRRRSESSAMCAPGGYSHRAL